MTDKEKKKTVKGDQRYLDDAWSLLAKERSLKQAFGRLLFVSTQDQGPVRQESGEGSCWNCSARRTASAHASVQGAILHEKEADKEYLAKERIASVVAVF